MSYPKLTPEQWAQIPEGYQWFAVDANGSGCAFQIEPYIQRRFWMASFGEVFYVAQFDATNWQNSLQKRHQTNEQPEATPTPRIPVVNVPYSDFMQIAGKLSLSIHTQEIGGKETVSAYLCNPASDYVCLFAADVPVNVTVHDSVNGIPVKIYDQI